MGCFCIMHWVIIHLRCEVLPHQFCSSLLNQSKDYSSVTVTIHPDTSIRTHVMDTVVAQVHWQPHMAIASAVFDR